MDTFSGWFWEIPGNVRKLELSKTLVDHKTPWFSTKQSLESLPEVFLTGEPNINKKKTATKHQFIALLAVEEKNKDVFSAIFSFECQFSTLLYFIQIPTYFFFAARYQHMINDDLSKKKKSPHFWEKSFVLSYFKGASALRSRFAHNHIEYSFPAQRSNPLI